MLITLENIQNQQFNQRFRGYDMAEVDAFLDKIAESYLFLSTKNEKLTEELDSVKNERIQSVEEEQSFKNAIISAQSFADDMKNKAENHATLLKEDAKEKATAILENAQHEIQTLQEQITLLSGEKERIKEELRTFLNTYLARVDDDSIAEPQVCPPADAEIVNIDQAPDLKEEPADQPKLEMEPADSNQDENSVESEDDIAILYEKIDLDDDLSEAEIAKISEDNLNNFDMVDDLEGDMLYSLDDPLDNQEPAVVIDPLDKETK